MSASSLRFARTVRRVAIALGAVLWSLVAGAPVRAQSPLVVGCADGTREGFASQSTYATIASCGGAWSVPGAFHDDPACGRLAGNDGINDAGAGCNVEDLCAGGWHVCHGPDDIDVRTAGKGCADAITATYPNNGSGPTSLVHPPGGAFFMTRTSGPGTGNCGDIVNGLPDTFNDIFGCGNMGAVPQANCAPLNVFGHNQCSGLQASDFGAGNSAVEHGYVSGEWAWTCNDGSTGYWESQHVVKTRPDDQGGVLCCKDTDGSLPEICDYLDNDADQLVDETDFFGDGSADDFPGDACTQSNGQPGTIACTNAGGWICGPIPPVSCCFGDGSCRDLAAGVCASAGGDSGGAGSRCANLVCEADPCWPGDGTPCDDGDLCTDDDRCLDGACGGLPLSCDDANPCTSDSCGPTGCVSVDNTASCDDRDPCTGGDVCHDGVCRGVGIPCDDGNDCTFDSCGDRGCEHEARSGGSCNDGDPCTSSETCEGGACRGVPISCDDGSPCTDDSCGRGGCSHVENAAPCDDGDVCTTGEACARGTCGGGAAVVCDDGNPCTDDVCGPSGCASRDNNAACDDGDGCTSGDVCSGGVCGGVAISCDDHDPCTDDSCGAGGCAHANNTASCQDGDACTGGDRCGGGVCVPGSVNVCACVEGDDDDDAICDEIDDCIDVDQDGYGVGEGCPPDCNDEVATCTTDCVSDFDGGDGNGIPDCEEAQCVDADGDGYGAGPGCSGADCDDASPACARDCTDGDGDRVPNCRDDDDDDDGLTDSYESQAGTDATNADSDGDGVIDGDEVTVHDTDPTRPDSDGDGVNDGTEIALGADPVDASDRGVAVTGPGDGSSGAASEGCAGGAEVLGGLGLWSVLVFALRARRRARPVV